VIDFSAKESTKGRPEALNTVQLLKICSSNLGIGPQHAMHVAERLYLSGYLTYPRTESTSYPGKFDFKSVTQALTRNSDFAGYCAGLLSDRMKYPKAGKDAGDHPPITPTTMVASKGVLKGDEWRIYEYVCRHFLATISPDGKFLKKHVNFECGKQKYNLTGISMIDPGFTEVRSLRVLLI
jgi:DNA topoisomerase III